MKSINFYKYAHSMFKESAQVRQHVSKVLVFRVRKIITTPVHDLKPVPLKQLKVIEVQIKHLTIN